jgi:hypothetical protein
MGLSEIIKLASEDSTTGSEQAKVSIEDKAKHVKIHGIELGIRSNEDLETSKPNPIELQYSWESEIVVHKTVGQKPITQCTIPEGLWSLVVRFNTLKGPDGGLSDVLTKVKELKAGPGMVSTALFNEGICMYLQKKHITQTKGTEDYYHTVELTLIEANDGS